MYTRVPQESFFSGVRDETQTRNERVRREKMQKKGERKEIRRRGVHLYGCVSFAYTRAHQGVYICECVLRVIRGAIKRRKSLLARQIPMEKTCGIVAYERESRAWARAQQEKGNV